MHLYQSTGCTLKIGKGQFFKLRAFNGRDRQNLFYSIIYNTLGWKGSLEPNFSDPFVTYEENGE
jgi:hypothetical protein